MTLCLFYKEWGTKGRSSDYWTDDLASRLTLLSVTAVP